MRMWMVKPEWMCNQHLLGEHVELHMLLGTINSGRILSDKQLNLLDPSKLHERHEALADEMAKRGMNHHSPLEPFRNDYVIQRGSIDLALSLETLKSRCARCSILMRR